MVGAGQAGLSVSRELAALGVEPVVFERGRVGQTWRDRWESFCLVTPNWSMRLPGGAYDGPDPDGFMPRDEIVGRLERYAESTGAQVREGVDVRSIDPSDDGVLLGTSAGDVRADAVVIATGAYRRPHRPAAASSLPESVLQIDVEGYRSEEELPAGRVLVVGSGQSGCQIAEELHEAGRDVVLACGRAPWLPRRIGDHDLVWWLAECGFLEDPVDVLPSPSARLSSNILATGHDGGHDLHLRTLRDLGVTLAGRFLGADGDEGRFAPDLRESVAWGDERYRELAARFRRLVEDPGLEEPPPFGDVGPERVDLRDFGAVVFTTGFRPDYVSWLDWPDAFDELGFPVHEDGESLAKPGIFFVGVHFLRKRKSALLLGVGEDAAIVARRVATRVGVT
ncbi:MAG TPA: NAD(P)/FAD-dependent oxidoreductase [Gaiellaceae bacterium]|nr:NAD(P)/FAD-dependent oxidoreductase [Gaiellaceae bacterium]